MPDTTRIATNPAHPTQSTSTNQAHKRRESPTAQKTQAHTPRIHISVCYHNFSAPIIGSEILRPIIVGAANMGEKASILQAQLESKLSKTPQQLEKLEEELEAGKQREWTQVALDSSGENISHLNPHFCELTAMYWAWKNVESDYYGLFHYRRVLDLHQDTINLCPDAPILRHIDEFAMGRFGLVAHNITRLCQQYDIIVPYNFIDRKGEAEFRGKNLYEIYAHFHYAKDMDIALDYIRSTYPYMVVDIESALFSCPPRWHLANMSIMRRELFFEYCEWIFSVLFAVQKTIDISAYSPHQARVFGFLSERLFNVWLAYKIRTANPRIRTAPLVMFIKKKPFIGWDINTRYKRFYFLGLRVYKKRIEPKP